MRIATIVAAALLVFACASSEPAHVRVIGEPQDLVPLAGEWVGAFESAAGRSGSITFHLTDDPKGAHGDVLMVARRETVRGSVPMYSSVSDGAHLLSIEFVRVAAGEISGRIAPYPDPDIADATLETYFAGHVRGDRIEGTFVTHSDHGVAPQRGTWHARRKPAS